jgi:hypothetical protein
LASVTINWNYRPGMYNLHSASNQHDPLNQGHHTSPFSSYSTFYVNKICWDNNNK